MDELMVLWENIPNIVKIPALVLLAWAIIAKIIVGITSGGTELAEEESTRAFGIFIAPIAGGLFLLWEIAKTVNRFARFMKYPGAKDDDNDVELL